MKKVIGNFIVEVGESVLMIKNLKGYVLKAESVKPFDSDEKFKELCTNLTIGKITRSGLMKNSFETILETTQKNLAPLLIFDTIFSNLIEHLHIN